MATPILYSAESSLNFRKFKKHHNNSSLISFWAFLVSIFIYITVFYAFNLSPSSLLCTPKFWFIISNTLILIIAADFSANKKHRDLYDEYRNNDTRAISISSYEIRYVKIDEKQNMPKYRENEVYEELEAPEKIIVMVENNSPEIPQNKEKADKPEKKVINFRNLNRKVKIDRARVVKKREAKCVDRCNSENLNSLAGNKKKDDNRKTLSERYDDVSETTTFQENEFSRMTDEELNRRVEDFIRRFNREIRLQAVNGS